MQQRSEARDEARRYAGGREPAALKEQNPDAKFLYTLARHELEKQRANASIMVFGNDSGTGCGGNRSATAGMVLQPVTRYAHELV